MDGDGPQEWYQESWFRPFDSASRHKRCASQCRSSRVRARPREWSTEKGAAFVPLELNQNPVIPGCLRIVAVGLEFPDRGRQAGEGAELLLQPVDVCFWQLVGRVTAQISAALGSKEGASALAASYGMPPDETTVLAEDGRWVWGQARKAAVTDSGRVPPGERILLDGVVTEGTSGVNEPSITGDSIPTEKAHGTLVFTLPPGAYLRSKRWSFPRREGNLPCPRRRRPGHVVDGSAR